jgi:hypothetical protein
VYRVEDWRRSRLRSAIAVRARTARAAIAWGLVVVGLVWGARQAAAAPRLVLIDGTEAPFLHEALKVSLQPWAFEVVDWPSEAGAGAAAIDAAQIAQRANARYVVWFDGDRGELVVVDAALQHSERRPLAALPADEPEATAVALSVKTLLRLPAPTTGERGPRRWQWIPSIRLGPRFGIDGDASVQVRAVVGLEVAPPPLHGLRLGIFGDVGSKTGVNRAGFKGDWSEWNAVASVSKALAMSKWVVVAQVAGGVSRAALSGEEMRVARQERNLTPAAMAALSGSRSLGAVSVGVAAAVVARGAAQFARPNGQPLWSEPGFLVEALGVIQLRL